MSVADAILPVMEASHGATLADRLSKIPVVTDADVLARVDVIIEPESRKPLTLWVFFLNPDGTQPMVIMPIDDIPEQPDVEDGEFVFQMLSHLYGPDSPDGSLILTISRDGTTAPTEGDRRWLRALQHGVAEYAAPVRMFCLATPEGVRDLGPVSPGSSSSPHAASAQEGHVPAPAAAAPE
jgi:hypothetical protein